MRHAKQATCKSGRSAEAGKSFDSTVCTLHCSGGPHPLEAPSLAYPASVLKARCVSSAHMHASCLDLDSKGHFEVVKELVGAGSPLNPENNEGCTPLHYAAKGGHINIVDYLLAAQV